MKRKKGETQANELNIIYSETKEQFYKKYDKYRKNENLKGLGLANINYPPKIKFKELNKKISEIKKKVANVKSILFFKFLFSFFILSKSEFIFIICLFLSFENFLYYFYYYLYS